MPGLSAARSSHVTRHSRQASHDRRFPGNTGNWASTSGTLTCTVASCDGLSKGRGARRTPSSSANIAVVDPTPRDRIRTTVSESPMRRRSPRTPSPIARRQASHQSQLQTADASSRIRGAFPKARCARRTASERDIPILRFSSVSKARWRSSSFRISALARRRRSNGKNRPNRGAARNRMPLIPTPRGRRG